MQSKSLSRRHFLKLSAVAAGAAVLAGCAPQAAPAPAAQQPVVTAESKKPVPTAAPKAGGTTTIRFITNDVGWREQRYRQIIPGFEQTFPDVKIDYTHTSDDQNVALTTWAAGGTIPDVFYSRTQQTGSRARLGWIMPLTQVLDVDPERDSLLADFWPVQVPQLKYKDEWYLIPENISSISFKFRPEFFDEKGVTFPDKPWTMDEFKAVCEKLIVREGNTVKRWPFDPSWWLNTSGFAWIWLPGGIVDPGNNKAIIDNPENAKMLNFIQDMKFKDKLIPRSEDIPEGLDMFANDRVAMMECGAWEVTSNRDALGKDKHWDIALLPQNPLKGTENLSINYGAGYAMGRDTKSPASAWKLLRYLSRPEMQQLLIVEDNWTLPGRKSVADAWAQHVLASGTGEPKHAELWRTALETGRSVPVTPAEKELEDQYPNLIGPILTTGEKRAEEALPQIQKDIQAILDKYA